MDTEQIAWAAFRLNGSIEAYLLHTSLMGLAKNNEGNQWKERMD
jgi:hypothetical protein